MPGGHWRPTRQSGVVLLSVLLILALLSAITYQMVGRQSLVVAQARQTFSGDQALEYALGGEAFARQILYEDWSQTGQGVDNLTEAWAQPLAPFEVEDGFLEIQIRDLNGCFNLNSVALNSGGSGTLGLERFRTLLRHLNLPDTIADAWIDWIDPDEEISAYGAEDGEYLLRERPYRTANRSAGHVSELALLRDMEAEQLEQLSSAVCVIPSDRLQLNINTASAIALAALHPALSEVQMLAITEGVRTYTSVNEITSQQVELQGAVDALSVTSEYFEVQIRAQVGESITELASVLRRAPEDGVITLLSRDFGRSFRSLFSADDVEGDGAAQEAGT
ncbi:MAG: type II secretion system minor pseudopilin GspK [Pseudomonadales bacterium]